MTATDELDATPAVPPVVVVVVSRDPGEWFEECLASIAAQEYPDLAVLVIDAASGEPLLPRVAEVLPGAFVRRLEVDPGYGPGANEVLGMVEGAAYYAFCHDDVALDPSAIRVLVEEAFRSNAGVVGPKLVQWDDPARLLQVGMAADKGGVLMPFVELGELDQEQHDAVRDVFVAPGGCTLIRADLFATLGGFDPGIPLFGEDLDLCWRAQVAGARVLVAPGARARHRAGGLVDRIGTDEAARLRNRHRLRTVLTCYGRFHLLRVLPQLVVLSAAELAYAVVTRDRAHVRRVVGAWWWNWKHRAEIGERRRALREVRRFPDGEVRKLQVGGSARLRRFVRGELATTKLGEELEEIGDELEEIVRARPRKLAAVAWVLLAVVFLVGTRDLLAQRIPAVAGFAPFDDGPVDLARRYLSGWQPAGLGSTASQPTGLALLAVGGAALLGGMGLLQQLLVLGAIPIGAVGMWRLTRPLGSPNARGVGLLLYGVVPLPWDSIATGSWAGLLLYAAAPWLLSALADAGPEPPGDQARRRRSMRERVLGLGLGLALVAAFVPLALVLALLVAAAVALGGVVSRPPHDAEPPVAAAAEVLAPLKLAFGAVAVAVALHLPWALELLGGDRWSLAGVAGGGAGGESAGELLRFETGPVGDSWLGWAMPMAGLLAILIGRAWRFRWAVRCWTVAVSCWALAVAGARTDLGLPPAEVLLAPGAAALALAGALGVSAFELDLRGFRFGWRQLAAVVAAAAVALAALPVTFGALEGSWTLESADHAGSLRSLGLGADVGIAPPGGARVLWIGAPELLPVAGFRLDGAGLTEAGVVANADGGELAYAVTTDTTGGLVDRWATSETGAVSLVEDALEVAAASRTDRLGAILARFGIRFLVLVDRAAPERTGAEGRAVPAALTETVNRQLDLRRIEVEPAIDVFEVAAPGAVRTRLAPASGGTGSGVRAALALDDPLRAALALAGGDGVLVPGGGTDTFRGEVEEGTVVLAAPSDDRWRLTVDGEVQERDAALGWANAWSTPAGRATLTYESPLWRPAIVVVQALAWLAATILVLRHWRRRS